MGHTWTVNDVNLQGWLEADPVEGLSTSQKLLATFVLVTETAAGIQDRAEVRTYAQIARAVLNGLRAGSRVYVKGRLREGKVYAFDVRFVDGPVGFGAT